MRHFWAEVNLRAGFAQGDQSKEMSVIQRRVVRNRTIPLMRHPGLATSSWRGDLANYRGCMSRLYTAVSHVGGKNLVIDSSKRPAHVGTLLDGL